MKQTIVGIAELRTQTKTLFGELPDHDVVVVRYATPVAIIIHPDRLEHLVARIEDLEDQVAVLSATGDLVPQDVAEKQLLGDTVDQ